MAESGLLMMQFLEWVSARSRTYEETMEAWRSTCPRLTVWEDARLEGLIQVRTAANGSEVCLTPRGRAMIHESKEVPGRSHRLSA